MTKAVSAHYAGEQGAAYFAWQSHTGTAGAKLNAAKFQDHIGTGDTVVDFGCGSGLLLEHLVARRRIGIEPNEHARRAIDHQRVELVSSPADLADGLADVVISNHALEHTLCPWEELRELRRVLRPGGRLVVRVPLDVWRRRAPASDVNHHLYTWTPLLLRNLLGEAGFEVRDVRVVTRAWPPHFARCTRVLPPRGFDGVAWMWSALLRRRELAAYCVR